MKLAVIGSGFFGITLGLVLSKKHEVDIYEKENSILNGASSSNQFRFHLGYHYPRSQKTMHEINKSKDLFISYFGKKVFGKTFNYYLVANTSKTSYKKYEQFLIKNNLYYVSKNLFSNNKFIEKTILTKEKILNIFNFKKIVIDKIKKSNLNLKLKKEFNKKNLEEYDKVIIATYSNNNLLLRKLGIKKLSDYKFQLVEKILVKLPKQYSKKSFIVIDGNYVCVDPYLGTKYHLLSDVKLSKLETTIGKFPTFKNKNKKYLNKGIIKNIKISRFNKFINRSSSYLPFLREAKYIGSMYVVRTIKKNKEKTDERTSSVNFHSNKILSVLSGKWNNCVFLAKNFKFN
tara:strand:- start:603 stop:1637 length:1035 start_codon:yes stop_codon:yes gene_type:complete